MSRAGELRVATYNVHRCVGTDRRLRPGRVAALLRALDADVIGLQEVQATRGPVGFDQARYLADALGAVAVSAPTLQGVADSYGNALLTRVPVLAQRRLDLSVPGREPRGALVALLDAGVTTPLRVVVTHLGLRWRERARQAKRLLAALPEAAPVVLLGDFNVWRPAEPALRLFERRFDAQPSPPTFPSWFPTLALDRVWASSPWRVRERRVGVGIRARLASDHLPLLAELS